jgi:hypothetical protein
MIVAYRLKNYLANFDKSFRDCSYIIVILILFLFSEDIF